MFELILTRAVEVCGAFTMAGVIMAAVEWIDAPRKSQGRT